MICIECKKEDQEVPNKTNLERMSESNCFFCWFWQGYVKVKDNSKIVRYKNEHYCIGAETNEPSNWKGFGGAKFIITMKDGREVTTTNLWSQGEIPIHFRDRLPDNAISLKRK